MIKEKQIPPIQVRLPDGMRENIRDSAKASFRTMQAEILYRLNLLEELKKNAKSSNSN